jgi:phage tail-like protein
MSIERERPYPGMNFTVEMGQGEEKALVEVVFPEARLQMVDYRPGNDLDQTKMLLPTVTKYGNLILRRGAIGSLNWYQWWDASRKGDQDVLRDITVSLLSEDSSEKVMTWIFRRAHPFNYQFSRLNGLGMEPLIESLEVAFERMEIA